MGDAIPIEERSADEVLFVQGKPIAPKGTKALHLGFDVTPHRLYQRHHHRGRPPQGAF